MASARAASSWLTDSMSQTAAVSDVTSADRSRTAPRASRAAGAVVGSADGAVDGIRGRLSAGDPGDVRQRRRPRRGSRVSPAAPQPHILAAMSERNAWGHGLTTITDDGQVLDTWFPQPALGERPADAAVPEGLDGARRHRRGAPRAHRGPPRRDRPRRSPGRRARRLPAPAPALALPRRAQHDQPRRRLRRAAQHRLDERRRLRRSTASSRPGCGCAPAASTSRSTASTSSRG